MVRGCHRTVIKWWGLWEGGRIRLHLPCTTGGLAGLFQRLMRSPRIAPAREWRGTLSVSCMARTRRVVLGRRHRRMTRRCQTLTATEGSRAPRKAGIGRWVVSLLVAVTVSSRMAAVQKPVSMSADGHPDHELVWQPSTHQRHSLAARADGRSVAERFDFVEESTQARGAQQTKYKHTASCAPPASHSSRGHLRCLAIADPVVMAWAD